MNRGRTVTGVVIGLLVMLLASGSAGASLPGPSALQTGFANEPWTPAIPTQWLRRAVGLNSSWWRIGVPWLAVAPLHLPRHWNPWNPADPHYFWGWIDGAVKDAIESGQTPMLMFTGAPTWAEQPTRQPHFLGTWRPSPAAIAAFAHALALRYSGRFPDPAVRGANLPRVGYFQVWNEPNLPTDVQPQWTQVGPGRYIPASPGIYRQMLNAGYGAIKKVQPTAYVLAAGTAPFGDLPGGWRMPPLVFLRSLFCLRGAGLTPVRCPNRAHFDALDHHPYAFSPTSHASDADNVEIADLGRLNNLIRRAIATHRVLPAGGKPVWVTEISWSTRPPDPGGIPPARQAHYLALTMYQLWHQGVSHVFWLEIRDPVQLTGGFDEGSGVYFSNGTPKPSSQAFRFPLVALRSRGRVIIWGRSPIRGSVAVQLHRARGWRSIRTLTTTSGGVFYATARGLRQGALLRALASGIASPSWRVS